MRVGVVGGRMGCEPRSTGHVAAQFYGCTAGCANVPNHLASFFSAGKRLKNGISGIVMLIRTRAIKTHAPQHCSCHLLRPCTKRGIQTAGSQIQNLWNVRASLRI